MSEERHDYTAGEQDRLPFSEAEPADRLHSQVLAEYAGFWMRFWAYLLDLIVIASINRLLIYPVFRIADIPLGESGMFAPATIATAAVFYLYFILMTKFLGQTLGKMAFGLKVVSLKAEKLSWATVLFREGVGRYIVSTVWILYTVAAFTPRKQGLYDMFADTAVLHERRIKSETTPAYS